VSVPGVIEPEEAAMKRLLAPLVLLAALVSCAPPTPDPEPDPSTAKDLTAFSFASPAVSGVIGQEDLLVTVEVPAGTDVTRLVAVFETTGACVTVDGIEQVSGETENDFTEAVAYVVEAEDGTTASYSVTVTAAAPPSSEKEITSFAITEPSADGLIDPSAGTISVVVPHGTDVSALVAVFQATGACVTVDGEEQESGKTVNDYTEPVTYIVEAEDGSTAEYEVAVEEAPGTEKEITSFAIVVPEGSGLIDVENRVIRARLPPGTNLSSLVAVFQITGASVSVNGVVQESGITANDFTLPLPYVVTAEDGSMAAYTVKVTGTIGLVINELDVDQPGTDRAEFVELRALAETDMTGIALVQVNGSVVPGSEHARVDLGGAGILPAGSSLVIAGPNVTVDPSAVRLTPPGWDLSNRIQNGPNDAVVLLDTIGGRIVDAVAYAGALTRAVIDGMPGELNVTEGETGAPADSSSAPGSIGRSPDGIDTGSNGTDFVFSSTPTPGSPNQ
jgi:hypothetical protein